MDGWMDGWTDGRMDGWTDGWMDGWMDGNVCFSLSTRNTYDSKHVRGAGMRQEPDFASLWNHNHPQNLNSRRGSWSALTPMSPACRRTM